MAQGLFANFADVLVSLPYKLPLVHVKAIEAWVDEEDRKNRVFALNEIGCTTYKIVEYAAGEDRLVEADE